MNTFIDTFTPAKTGFLEVSEGESLEHKDKEKVGNTSTAPQDFLLVSSPRADPALGQAGHLFLILLFGILFLLYVILALSWHFTRPDEESFMQISSQSLPSVPLKISVKCSSSGAGDCGAISIWADYSVTTLSSSILASSSSSATTNSLSSDGLCANLLQNYTTAPTAAATSLDLGDGNTIPLCYLDDFVVNPMLTSALPVPGIQVDISQFFNSASVEVVVAAADGSFSRSVNLDAWQVKTLLIEQSVSKRDGSIISRTSRPLAIQYEGGRSGPTTSNRATLLIQQVAFANVYEINKPGSIGSVIAGFGGAFYVLFALMSLIAPCLTVCCPGSVKIHERELADQKKKEEEQELENEKKLSPTQDTHEGVDEGTKKKEDRY